MMTTERTSIASPATGLEVYDTDLNQFYFFNGSIWTAIPTGSNANNYWTLSGWNIYNNTGTYVGIGATAPDITQKGDAEFRIKKITLANG